MSENKTKELIEQINKLDYNEKKNIYQAIFSLGYISTEEMNDRLVLISLVALSYKQLKLKDKTLTPLKLLEKITGHKPGSSFYEFLIALSIIVEDFSYGIKKIDTCGLKTSQEIINKIKELLNTWLPF